MATTSSSGRVILWSDGLHTRLPGGDARLSTSKLLESCGFAIPADS
jgi:hypothetical protein